jgi:hypothetical protein
VASGNRTITLPQSLIFVVEKYQGSREISSFSAAIKELLETHPALAFVIRDLYDRCNSIPRE